MRMLIAGRLVFALVGLALVAVPAYLIKTVVMDKVDDVTKEVGFENVPSDPTDIDASESLYRADNFGEALRAGGARRHESGAPQGRRPAVHGRVPDQGRRARQGLPLLREERRDGRVQGEDHRLGLDRGLAVPV